jgi:hypothetical protein
MGGPDSEREEQALRKAFGENEARNRARKGPMT